MREEGEMARGGARQQRAPPPFCRRLERQPASELDLTVGLLTSVCDLAECTGTAEPGAGVGELRGVQDVERVPVQL